MVNSFNTCCAFVSGCSRWIVAYVVFIILPQAVNADTENTNASATGDEQGSSLQQMELQDLLQQHSQVYRQSVTASSVSESLRDAPAALVVIDRGDIRRRGYDSLDDILQDLPGFDTITTNGTEHVVTYQRGYRTPWTQRTLFLINGKVDNNMWMHGATFSRQYPMQQIERVEVLYGPSGAVYGPNAFLGVVNIITRNVDDLLDGENTVELSVSGGSFNTRALELSLLGKREEFGYSFGARIFKSDEADLSDYSDWGYSRSELLQDSAYWGAGIGEGEDPAVPGFVSPAGDLNVDGKVSARERINGEVLGQYADPSKNTGLLGELYWKNWTLGVISWETDESYGPYYSFVDAQPSANWFHKSNQLYLNNHYVIKDGISLSSEGVYRENSTGGDWVESFGTNLSISDWLSSNSAWRFEQQLNIQYSPRLRLTTGIKYERKALTKSYMICNYWEGSGFCPAQGERSTNGLTSDGSGVILASEVSSANPMQLPPSLDDNIPDFNIEDTSDKGMFVQAIYAIDKWRFNGGIRWDKNSVYGSEVNPRGAAIYHWNKSTTLKLVYGEAFQEPSPKDLYGSWTGRDSNADLKSEKVRTLEFIGIHQAGKLLFDTSLYYSRYQNVITSSANVGGRDIFGLETRTQYRMDNFIPGSSDITGNLFYAYTRAMAERQYENSLDQWVDQQGIQGDIAPHKINFLVNIPIKERWNFNFRANWFCERELFSENPLRADSNADREHNRKAKSYTRFDANLLYSAGRFSAGFKIENLFSEEYLLPGVEGAGSGDDFSVDSDGFQNSLIPQVKSRIYTLTVSVQL
ncbi:TonB-dependent receptor plug domain-containing protein [Teredinibacter haidensis]|uniref:TonB-dependent receptor plug domain-containing protein n=1 Tax=Teredinibacter haidensis TaxID=2731755 RepID=UPI00094908A4|nr:TonB-dependent receptor [Teredinibacter haidensis]